MSNSSYYADKTKTKNSQAVLKIRENSENENTYIHKYREKYPT